MFHMTPMLRVDQQRLVTMALMAVEELAARCRHRPQQRTRGIALALAFLAHSARSREQWPYNQLWRSLHEPDRGIRSARVGAALNGIYLELGRQRDLTVQSAFEQLATAEFGPLPGFPANPAG